MTKIKLPQAFLVIAFAFIAGYFFCQLITAPWATDMALQLWFSAAVSMSAFVAAIFVGERQLHSLWKAVLDQNEQYTKRSHDAYLAVAKAAYQTLERMQDRYAVNRTDLLRVRVIYQADTFSSLIAALKAIPLHELDSAEAAVALAGLQNNMCNAQLAIEQLMVLKARLEQDDLPKDAIKSIDLRSYKAHAEMHYRTLVSIFNRHQ